MDNDHTHLGYRCDEYAQTVRQDHRMTNRLVCFETVSLSHLFILPQTNR